MKRFAAILVVLFLASSVPSVAEEEGVLPMTGDGVEAWSNHSPASEVPSGDSFEDEAADQMGYVESTDIEPLAEETTFELYEEALSGEETLSEVLESGEIEAQPETVVSKAADAALTVGEAVYTQADIDSGDLGNEYWHWDHSKRRLTLCGLSGTDIDIASANTIEIYVQGGSRNFVRQVYLENGGVVTGEGTLYCNEGLAAVAGSLGVENCDWHGTIAALGPVNLRNVYGDCDIATQNGDIRIEDSYIRGKIVVADGNLSVTSSLVEAFEAHDDHNGLLATGKVTLKQSLVLYKYIYGEKGESIDKNTAVFVYEGDSSFVLSKSATLKKSFDLPESYSYTIPKKVTLTIAKGCALSHLGRLNNNGKIKGNVIDRSFYPGEVVVQGATEMVVGSSQVLTYQYLSGERVVHTEWNSSDPKLVSVDRNGKVTVNKAASAFVGKRVTITCYLNDRPDSEGTIEITIAPGTESITIQQNGKDLKSLELWLDPANKEAILEVTVYPHNAPKNVTWKTDKPKIITVGSDGTITAKKYGTATIWAEATDGTGVVSKKITVTVLKAPSSVKITKKLNLSYDPIKGVGMTGELNPVLSKGSASTLTYSGYDPDIVEVNENGKVTAKGFGSTKITVKTYNRKKATCTVTVINPYAPTGIKLDKKSTIKLTVGETIQLNAELTPATVIDTIKWTTSKASVATVEDGLVTAVKKGSATITVTTSNGKKAKVKIKVVK